MMETLRPFGVLQVYRSIIYRFSETAEYRGRRHCIASDGM
jgi:hypothetical protein